MGKCCALGVQMWTASIAGSQDLAVISCNGRDGKALAQAPRSFNVSASNCSHFDGFNSTHRFGMNAAHESGAEDCCPESFHRYCFLHYFLPDIIPADFLTVR